MICPQQNEIKPTFVNRPKSFGIKKIATFSYRDENIFGMQIIQKQHNKNIPKMVVLIITFTTRYLQ